MVEAAEAMVKVELDLLLADTVAWMEEEGLGVMEMVVVVAPFQVGAVQAMGVAEMGRGAEAEAKLVEAAEAMVKGARVTVVTVDMGGKVADLEAQAAMEGMADATVDLAGKAVPAAMVCLLAMTLPDG